MTLDLIVQGPAGLHSMRSELVALLDREHVDDRLAGDIVLAASELATNGFRHGEADTVHVQSTIEPDSVQLTLRHADGPTRAKPDDRRRDDAGVPVGGRGLRLVDQICSWREVEVTRGERFTRVTFARD